MAAGKGDLPEMRESPGDLAQPEAPLGLEAGAGRQQRGERPVFQPETSPHVYRREAGAARKAPGVGDPDASRQLQLAEPSKGTRCDRLQRCETRTACEVQAVEGGATREGIESGNVPTPAEVQGLEGDTEPKGTKIVQQAVAKVV